MCVITSFCGTVRSGPDFMGGHLGLNYLPAPLPIPHAGWGGLRGGRDEKLNRVFTHTLKTEDQNDLDRPLSGAA